MRPPRALTRRYWIAFWIVLAIQAGAVAGMLVMARTFVQMLREMGFLEEAIPNAWLGIFPLALGTLWIVTMTLWGRERDRQGSDASEEARTLLRKRCWSYLMVITLLSQLCAWGTFVVQLFLPLSTHMESLSSPGNR